MRGDEDEATLTAALTGELPNEDPPTARKKKVKLSRLKSKHKSQPPLQEDEQLRNINLS